jgi:hypothetical protein
MRMTFQRQPQSMQHCRFLVEHSSAEVWNPGNEGFHVGNQLLKSFVVLSAGTSQGSKRHSAGRTIRAHAVGNLPRAYPSIP